MTDGEGSAGRSFSPSSPGGPLDPPAGRPAGLLAGSCPARRAFPDAGTFACPGRAGWGRGDRPAGAGSRLLGRADSALYLAKAQGRDRVVAASAEQTPLPTLAL